MHPTSLAIQSSSHIAAVVPRTSTITWQDILAADVEIGVCELQAMILALRKNDPGGWGRLKCDLEKFIHPRASHPLLRTDAAWQAAIAHLAPIAKGLRR